MTIIYDSPTTTYDSPTVTYEGSGGASTGYIFTPPNVKFVPPFLPDSTPLDKSLWEHFENRERGVNVFIMSDNSVVQSDPTPENSNTDMTGVYPWNIDNPSGPYVRSIYIDAGANPQVPTEHDVESPGLCRRQFLRWLELPRHRRAVRDPARITPLTGPGYADCLTPN